VRVTAPGSTTTTNTTVRPAASTTTVTAPPRVRSTTVTLPPETVRVAAPARTTTKTRTRTVTAEPESAGGGADAPSQYYANCSEARAAGVTPLYAGDPGYASHLDRDDDGVACE
jgi:hypothetical protein